MLAATSGVTLTVILNIPATDADGDTLTDFATVTSDTYEDWNEGERNSLLLFLL